MVACYCLHTCVKEAKMTNEDQLGHPQVSMGEQFLQGNSRKWSHVYDPVATRDITKLGMDSN